MREPVHILAIFETIRYVPISHLSGSCGISIRVAACIGQMVMDITTEDDVAVTSTDAENSRHRPYRIQSLRHQ
jgi:hypothetical protein